MRCAKSFETLFGRLSATGRLFRNNQNGAIAPIFALLLIPLLFAMMLAVDTANLMRVRGNVQHALDAAALAVGKRFSNGASENDMRAFGKKIFESNLSAIEAKQTVFKIDFPLTNSANRQITANVDFPYTSFFGKAVKKLSLNEVDWDKYNYKMSATVRLKNTIEVALVLDNSGSMSSRGAGSSDQRIVLLRKAATDLVAKLAEQARQVTFVTSPVQFSIVPFDVAVNVGPQHATAPWMDQTGISPIQYENFTMPALNKSLTLTSTKKITNRNGVYIKEGTGWGSAQNGIYTRFTLYEDLGKISNRSQAKWAGCVEERSGIYGVNADAATVANAETMYVPMFANADTTNNWWSRGSESTTAKQKSDLVKYYATSKTDSIGSTYSPNYSCNVTPITPLTDVSNAAGLKTIQDGIALMAPRGGTNVPEGMVWGWRTLTDTAPFANGRSSEDPSNDKVIIVLTDGQNDIGSNYSSLGYPTTITQGYDRPRVFQETNYTNQSVSYYPEALNVRFKRLCELAKKDNIIIMSVALDLGNSTSEKKQIENMMECASFSRVRADPTNPAQQAKLFWNSKGSDLVKTFKEIADELSNLRVIH